MAPTRKIAGDVVENARLAAGAARDRRDGVRVMNETLMYRLGPVELRNPPYALTGRLWLYRAWIAEGKVASLVDAVKLNAQLWRRWHDGEKHDSARREWERRVRLKAQRQYQHNRAYVLAAGGPCAYCGNPEVTEADHVVPRAQGGTHAITNLAPACTSCNREKSGRTVGQWREWRLARGHCWPPAPSPAAVQVRYNLARETA